MPMHDAVRRLIDNEVLQRVHVELREKLRIRMFYTKEVNLLLKANEM